MAGYDTHPFLKQPFKPESTRSTFIKKNRGKKVNIILVEMSKYQKEVSKSEYNILTACSQAKPWSIFGITSLFFQVVYML